MDLSSIIPVEIYGAALTFSGELSQGLSADVDNGVSIPWTVSKAASAGGYAVSMRLSMTDLES